MDDGQVGAGIRELRLRRRLTQQDLAAEAGVSRWTVARIERGRLYAVRLDAVRNVARALDASVELMLRWGGADLGRLLNARHAGLHEAVAAMFGDLGGWTLAHEVSFSIYGERGVIDILAWHPVRRALVIIELKTEIVDLNDLLGSMDRRRRLARRIALDRGFDPETISVWVIVAEGATNRRRVADHAALLRSAFPSDGRTMNRWLRDPIGPVAALSFRSIEHVPHLKTGRGGPSRVRRRRGGTDACRSHTNSGPQTANA